MSLDEFFNYLEQANGSNNENEEVDFDLNWAENAHGNVMIVYEKGNKTYIISPEQYKLTILGFNRSFTYTIVQVTTQQWKPCQQQCKQYTMP